MGIKFNCPNGHRMNVKSFLAGKKGKCPKCGVAVDVPMQSVEADVAETMIAPAQEEEGPPEYIDSGDDADVDLDDNVVAMERAAAKAAARSASRMPKPIADDPMAYWYTCNQSGDRYGPVTGEALNRWLDEGRVAPESLVWREGWPQWRKADGVFPTLRAKSPLAGLFGDEPAAPAADTPAQPKMDDLLSDAIAGAASYEAGLGTTTQRSRYKDKLMLTSMVLIGAVTVLGVVLLLVILN